MDEHYWNVERDLLLKEIVSLQWSLDAKERRIATLEAKLEKIRLRVEEEAPQ